MVHFWRGANEDNYTINIQNSVNFWYVPGVSLFKIPPLERRNVLTIYSLKAFGRVGINIGVGWEGGGRKKKVFRHAQGRFRRDNQGLCTHRRMVASLHRHYIDCTCLLPSTSLILHPGTGQSSTCLRDLKTVLKVCVWVLLVNKSTDTSWLPTNWRLFTFPSWFGPVESCCGHMVVNQCGKCTQKFFRKKRRKERKKEVKQKKKCVLLMRSR